MSTTIPHDSEARQRSSSRTRAQTPPPRPATPLRPPSRSSLRGSHTPTHGPDPGKALQSLEPAFGDLSDGMANLEANFMHLQLMHESLTRFNECFASFLHGMKVNAFCVDFPEAPVPESFRRAHENPQAGYAREPGISQGQMARSGNYDGAADADQTFLTTDTSFVDNPPASSIKSSSTTSQYTTPKPNKTSATTATRGAARGAAATASGRGTTGRGRPSGLARATTRGRGTIR